jgi:lipoyl(octanoyl) transferase
VDKWWFLDTGLSHGAKNMAIDEVLATRIVPKANVPVFRIYGWQPYAISLGYGQDPKKLDLQKCRLDGIDIVRRPTGGRAVFHAEEITYSVIIPKDSVFYSPDILSTYNLISKGLLAGLKLFGIDTQLVKRRVDEKKSATYKNDVPCFSFSAEYEIAYANKKLVGSAQRRYENSILQHGSILTGVRHLKLADYIIFSDELLRKRFKEELTNKTISISQILNQKVDRNKLIKNLKIGMQNSFNIELIDKKLSPHELNGVNKPSKLTLN